MTALLTACVDFTPSRGQFAGVTGAPVDVDPPEGFELVLLQSYDVLERWSEFPHTVPERVDWEACAGERGEECWTGFDMARHHLREGVDIDVYNLRGDAGGRDDDARARAQQLEQLGEYLSDRSSGRAVLIGGHTHLTATDAGMVGRFLEAHELHDACEWNFCDAEDHPVRWWFRGGVGVDLEVEAWWQAQTLGAEPVAVEVRWAMERYRPSVQRQYPNATAGN